MGRPSRYDHGFVSVTTVVDIIDKPGLRYWYGKFGIQHCEEKKRTSQSIGHKVHAGIERFLKGASISKANEGLSNDQSIMLSYLTDWCSRNKPKVVLMEEPLYSYVYKFAGTPDLICKLGRKKEIVIADWKTDSTPSSKADEHERQMKYLWQVSGYAIAYEEMHGVKINQAYILRASKDLQFKEYCFKDLEEGKKDFLMLRYIYQRVKGK